MSPYSKTCVKRPLSKRPKMGFQDHLSLDAGQKYCRMLQGEQSAILSTFIKLTFVIKIFDLSIFEWPFTQVLLYLSLVLTVKALTRLHIRYKLVTLMKAQEYSLICCISTVDSR